VTVAQPKGGAGEGLAVPAVSSLGTDAAGAATGSSARPEPEEGHRVGLALSGGGSRAAAFHRGTVRALRRVGLLGDVDVVSTVSGGSVFGGAWMAARARGASDDEFLESMAEELARGFVARSIGPRLLKTLLPGYSRTDLVADTFDRILFRGATLGSLPERPRLCINASVLNHGQVAKFSRGGFSTWDVRPAGAGTSRIVPIAGFRLARAVAASAAFPVGLPPLVLSRARDLRGAELAGDLLGHDALALTDGGVLENLGVQTLLASERFRTWDLVVSDAGAREAPWRPGPLKPFKAAAIALLTGGALDQVMMLMNAKQNRWMRQHTQSALEESWFTAGLRATAAGAPLAPGLEAALGELPALPRRKLLFVRVNQSLESLVTGIPTWRLVELWDRARGGGPPAPLPSSFEERVRFVSALGVDLKPAREVYDRLGGAEGSARLNAVPTNFTALSRAQIEALAMHAEWQVLATHALYW
jgi:predicted acylesterase/phospholipase RssA